MTGLFLSRAALKRDPAVAALAALVLPRDDGARAAATHRLVWSLFAGDPDSRRDFLFREQDPVGPLSDRTAFMILSRRPPHPDNPLLDVETKDFSPVLAAGDRLGFSLRANPTRSRRDEQGRQRRHDVVMDALPKDGRAEARQAVITREGRRWLEAQAAKSGFRLAEDDDFDDARLRVDGYSQWRLPRLGSKGTVSVVDFTGEMEVTDPPLFLARLAEGIGRAKAFGCGLLLIRRV